MRYERSPLKEVSKKVLRDIDAKFNKIKKNSSKIKIDKYFN